MIDHKDITYYYLSDVEGETWLSNYEKTITATDFQAEVLTFTGEALPSSVRDDSPIRTVRAGELWYQYIVPKYRKSCIGTYAGEAGTYTLRDIKRNFMWSYIAILQRTFTKYDKVISLYEAKKANLIDGLTSTSFTNVDSNSNGTNTALTKFNDTPDGTGDYSGDSYTSSVNRTSGSDTRANTSESDSGSTVQTAYYYQLIADVEDKISNYYAEWAKQFDILFYTVVEDI